MFSWMIGWVWWLAWRSAVTLACALTIQHIVHEQDRVWIDTKSIMIGCILTVLLIRIWSMPKEPKGLNQ